MSDSKLPQEGARYSLDGSANDGDSFDEMESMDSYFLEAEDLKKENAKLQGDLAALQEKLKALQIQHDELSAQKGDFDLVRSGRDARVMSLEAETRQLEQRILTEQSARNQADEARKETGAAFDKMEKAFETASHERDALKALSADAIRKHRWAIGGAAALALLLGWGWFSSASENSALEDTNTQLTASNEAYAADRRSTADLRAEIDELSTAKTDLETQVSALQGQLNSAQSRNSELAERERNLRAINRGDVPSSIPDYSSLRLTFLNYINGLSSRFPIGTTYQQCIRGEILDELGQTFNSRRNGRWDSFADSTKNDIEYACRGRLPRGLSNNEKDELIGNVLNDYMYRQGNFLEAVQQAYGR